ncbi:hypothetical protein SOV_52530 [Sporomusa ovata DSM 2662]|uniref:Uncharacterized protein n=1 Tax=Sporomusa ovata TaxID=2378 RepID=A0A0U1KRT3_9FIRM|nr:hypothetical protein [Sporomusa ovata]EQB27625.1 hypothetical protein SOV_2c05220 [Sporomusa ovata DSM 2662]CQR69975.1 hypothetical protein SpAn4DRAFT_4840 [Sporomusa ovata]
MIAPREILDALESILQIFLSDIRHKERAAFILCDNLVEMACKTGAKQNNHSFNTTCGFHAAWNAPGVTLDPNGIGARVQQSRDTRNNMQHASAASTVDIRYCADALLDAVAVIDQLWPNTSTNAIHLWMKLSIRIVRLYSSVGNHSLQQRFEDNIRHEEWRTKQSAKKHEQVIEPGIRKFWAISIKENPQKFEQILDSLGIH